jgi:hypothetical protein
LANVTLAFVARVEEHREVVVRFKITMPDQREDLGTVGDQLLFAYVECLGQLEIYSARATPTGQTTPVPSTPQ